MNITSHHQLRGIRPTLVRKNRLARHEQSRPIFDGFSRSELSQVSSDHFPSEPTLTDRVQSTLKTARTQIRSQADDDGVWRTAYKAGPYESLITSLGLNYIGHQGPDFYAEEKSILEQNLTYQAESGGVTHSEERPVSIGMTKLLLAHLATFEKNHANDLGDDPKFRAQLKSAKTSAQSYLKSDDAERAHPGQEAICGLLYNLTVDDSRHTFGGFLDPFHPNKANLALNTGVGRWAMNQLSEPVQGTFAAAAIISDKVGERQKRLAIMKTLRGKDGHRDLLRSFEAMSESTQDPNGGWHVVGFLTGLHLIAQHLQGDSNEHPAQARGIEFVRALRMRNDDGSVNEAWCQAEAWDTAIAGERLLDGGTPATDPLLKKSIDQLLKSQGSDGRWSFATNAETSLDNDSSTMPLGFLATSFATAAPEQKDQIKAAVKKCVDTLFERQQYDGGWNAYEPTKLGWGNRVPFEFEASIVDGSSPDVTGRVLRGLGMAKNSGLLDESQQRKLGQSVEKASEYLQDSQASNGSWWSRWITGYVTTPGFVLEGLREVGADMNQPWIQGAVNFVKSHQNADGGWGEETAADADAQLAGLGESTPSQTALAMGALLASKGDHSEALERGASYLLGNQEDGEWKNNKKIYTTIPGDIYYDSDLNTQSVATQALHRYLKRSSD
jgi:hypothetical protein